MFAVLVFGRGGIYDFHISLFFTTPNSLTTEDAERNSVKFAVSLAIARQSVLHGVGQDFFVSGGQLQAKFDA